MSDRFRDEYLRAPRFSPAPNRQIVEGRIWDAVYHAGIPHGHVEREVVHRVLGALGPLLAILDVPTATDAELKQIFGRANPALHARLMYDAEFAAVVHVTVVLRRQLDRLLSKQTIPALSPEQIADLGEPLTSDVAAAIMNAAEPTTD